MAGRMRFAGGPKVARHTMLVLLNAKEGCDEEFNRWYEDVHLSDILAVPGFVSARRFEAAEAQMTGAPRHRYMTLYEIETDDIGQAIKDLGAASGGMDLTDTMEMNGALSVVYSLTSER